MYEHATYRCSCEKHGFSKFSPHTCSNCPCALLMVIAKASRTGNCRRLNSNGISVIIIGMHGNRKSPLNFPFKMIASMILFIIFLTESLVPLQSRGGFMFRRRIIGRPIFNVKMCGGMPGKSSEFKNSVG